MAQRSKECRECGKSVPRGVGAGRRASKFCGTPCRKVYHARRAQRGAIIYDLAMRMRAQREKGDFADLCHQISLFLQQDAEDGRVTYFDYRREAIPYHFPAADPIQRKGKK